MVLVEGFISPLFSHSFSCLWGYSRTVHWANFFAKSNHERIPETVVIIVILYPRAVES